MYDLVGVVSYESGSGTMEIKFEPEIKDYIYDLKANFTMLNIPMMLSFRSGWSYRLYELLSSRAYHTKYDKETGNVFHIKYVFRRSSCILEPFRLKMIKARSTVIFSVNWRKKRSIMTILSTN